MVQTIYVDRQNIELKAEKNTLAFYTAQGRQNSIPFQLINRVIIKGHCLLDAQLLGKLAENDITTVILSSKKTRSMAVIPAKYHNDAKTRIKQYRLAQNKKEQLVASKLLIKAKLLRQYRLIGLLSIKKPDKRKMFFDSRSVIKKLIEQIKVAENKASLRGIEGAGAKQYFQCYCSGFKSKWNFHNRNKRPPKDPINSVLSFAYTLLHARCVQSIHTVGLDPLIGFFHELDYARYSLASDMMEPLRPIIDKFVWELFKDDIFSQPDFEHQNNSCLLNKEGRKKFYPVFEMMIKQKQKLLNQLARYMVNYLNRL